MMNTEVMKALTPLIVKAVNRQAESMRGDGDKQEELSDLLLWIVPFLKEAISEYIDQRDNHGSTPCVEP
jgi:hypothetical protein